MTMPIDPRIKSAIFEAVSEAGQDKKLSDKIVSWFEALVTGSESADLADSVHRRTELLFDSTESDEPNTDEA